MADFDATDIIDKYWPTQGPHTADSVAAAAAASRELMRYLAHATLGGSALDALPYASDAYPVAGGLANAAHSQEQVLQQMAAWAGGVSRRADLRHDGAASAAESRDRACVTALEAAEYLSEAATKATELARLLDQAQSALGHLYHDDEAN